MLAVQRSPPAPTRLLPWALPSEPAWASPPRGIGFVPVESPPRTVQEYVMQAARGRSRTGPWRRRTRPHKEATLDDAPRAPFLSPVVPSKRAAPKEPRPVPDVLEDAKRWTRRPSLYGSSSPSSKCPSRRRRPKTKALTRQKSVHAMVEVPGTRRREPGRRSPRPCAKRRTRRRRTGSSGA